MKTTRIAHDKKKYDKAVKDLISKLAPWGSWANLSSETQKAFWVWLPTAKPFEDFRNEEALISFMEVKIEWSFRQSGEYNLDIQVVPSKPY